MQNMLNRIIEINKQRKRAVGSIKAVLKGAKKEAEDKFWAEAKEGETVEEAKERLAAGVKTKEATKEEQGENK